MATYPIRPRTLGIAATVITAAFGASPAFAAITLPPVDQWSSYLLYGSIALLVAGVLAKMFTYSNGKNVEMSQATPSEDDVSIGAYRNKVLRPGN